MNLTVHVRFGGGLLEKEWKRHLASSLPYKNLAQAVEQMLESQRPLLKQITGATETLQPEAEAASSTAGQPETPPLPLATITAKRRTLQHEQHKQCRRLYRVERYQSVQTLFRRGLNISAIAAQLHLSRPTVRKLAQAAQFPERKQRAPCPCKLTAYLPYLRERWNEGCHNAAVLFQEIGTRGYTGGYTQVKAWLRTRREQTPTERLPPHDKLSPRQVAVWLLRKEEERTPRQQGLLARLEEASAGFRTTSLLTRRFLTMVRQQSRQEQSAALREWLQEALACEVRELRAFARSVQQDFDAVCSGLSLSWSNGPVEGSVNRLKFVKRRGYGRAHFDLLRRRVLQSG